MAMGFTSTARSVVGLVRSGNEDSGLIDSHLIAVADGMGGHAGGEVASAIAVKTLAPLAAISRQHNIDADSIEDLLLNSLYDIDDEIKKVARANIELTGMGTTLTTLMLYSDGENKKEQKVALLHVGDSRCYRLRGSSLQQLSHDHTVLQELLDQGTISAEEAQDHPQSSFLTQAIVGDGTLTPVLTVIDVKPKDRFLICSDGLSGVLSEKEIKQGMKISDPQDALTYLIDKTYSLGAPDNVTVILASVDEQVESLPFTYLGAAANE
ncbi:MAG: serine/threonine-protein phosphatase [Actinobacteria bacterium]|nr:serine/threonine-protein phosphatase [Actinomycetota bacterium]